MADFWNIFPNARVTLCRANSIAWWQWRFIACVGAIPLQSAQTNQSLIANRVTRLLIPLRDLSLIFLLCFADNFLPVPTKSCEKKMRRYSEILTDGILAEHVCGRIGWTENPDTPVDANKANPAAVLLLVDSFISFLLVESGGSNGSKDKMIDCLFFQQDQTFNCRRTKVA